MDAPRPLRVGVIGLGRAFTLMLATLREDPRVRIVAGCDPRAAARAQLERDFGARTHEDAGALVEDPEVEAVYVASPHGLHAGHVRLAAAARRHVLVEKPMAITLRDCADMIEACARAGVSLVVGPSHGFDAPYLLARRIVDAGDVGAPRMIHALNCTDFLYRPRRPEELDTAAGGGVVFSQAAHQVDVVRLLAGGRATRVHAAVGRWDPERPTEVAYSALLWFADGAFASLTYSGAGRFDTDAWMDGIGELGVRRDPAAYGGARRRLATVRTPEAEARLKADATYGGPAWTPPSKDAVPRAHEHFGPVLVACERADLRPVPDGVWVYGDAAREHRRLPPPRVPRAEVIDEWWGAVREGVAPLHGGEWSMATTEVCVALLESARLGREV
ncbi:MAG: Gfo/Idh/MocA family oxidoreductase, partial [Burkholderiales bacterium]